MKTDQDMAMTPPADVDLELFNHFIYDLNVARRQLSLYPDTHPQVNSSFTTVLETFKRLCQSHHEVVLGITPDSLAVNGVWIEPMSPPLRDFTTTLAARDIAAIHFFHDLSLAELIRFNRELISDSHQSYPEALNDRLQQHKVKGITVTAIDFSHFGMSDLTTSKQAGIDDNPWRHLVNALMKKSPLSDSLDFSSMDAKEVAQALNASWDKIDDQSFDDLFDTVFDAIQDTHVDSREALDEQLRTLISNLNPDIKNSLMDSTFRALDVHERRAEEVLPVLPVDMLTQALDLHNRSEHSISSRLVDLLAQFSTTTQTTAQHRINISTEPLADEAVRARIDILLIEDSHDEYLPCEYQAALSKILTGQVKGSFPPGCAARLRNDLEKQSIEKQCCSIVFNMLSHGVEADIEGLLQDHLTELSRFFLDTGDFAALQDIFARWNSYLYSTNTTKFLNETVNAMHTAAGFMNEVLDSALLWGEERFDEISVYLYEIGEPYAELLINRLRLEKSYEQRKIWIRLLISLGSKAHQLILANLSDERWYLVRNLLLVLSRQHDALPMKAILKLTEHSHARVREEAIRILLKCNPATANRLLLQELSSGHTSSMTSALQLAAHSRDSAVLHQLHQMLQSDLKNDENLKLKIHILDTLAKRAQPETIPVLSRLLKRRGLIRSRRQKEFHMAIIARLGSFPRMASEPLLNSLLNGRDRTASRLAAEQLESYKPTRETE